MANWNRLAAGAGRAIRACSPVAVTRHPVTRRVYDWLRDHGVAFTLLERYELQSPGQAAATPPDGVTIERTTGEATTEPLATAADTAVVARKDDVTIGHALVSDRPVPVPPLGGRVVPGGRYVWGVSVQPEARGRGIGSALVAEAASRAGAPEAGCTARRSPVGELPVWALIAPDNTPSRRIFQRNGFVRTGLTGYVRVGHISARVGRPVTAERD